MLYGSGDVTIDCIIDLWLRGIGGMTGLPSFRESRWVVPLGVDPTAKGPQDAQRTVSEIDTVPARWDANVCAHEVRFGFPALEWQAQPPHAQPHHPRRYPALPVVWSLSSARLLCDCPPMSALSDEHSI